MLAILILLVSSLVFTEAATVTWTGLQGTNLWGMSGNWDCRCVPSENDDVIINLPNAAGIVRVNDLAKCRSLTVGGGTFPQSLTISDSLMIANGGTLKENGFITIAGSPNSPVTTGGTFSIASNGFSFASGVLGGSGVWEVAQSNTMNLTGAAAKEISGKVDVKGKAVISSSTTSTLLLSGAGRLTVSGNLVVQNALTVQTNGTAAGIEITGSASYAPGSADASLQLQGTVSFSNLIVEVGRVVALNALTVTGTLTLKQGSTLSLLGGLDQNRVITKVDGLGSVIAQGGTNVIKSGILNQLNINAGANNFQNIQTTSLTVSGGELSGQIKSGSSIISGGNLKSASVITDDLNLSGIVTLFTSIINASKTATLTTGQLSLNDQSGFGINGVAKQSGSVKVIGGGKGASTIVNFGNWSISGSDSDLSLNGVKTTGSGRFDVSSGSSITLLNTGLDIAVIKMVDASLKVTQSTVQANQIEGSGNIVVQSDESNPFNVGSLAANSVTFQGTGTVQSVALSQLSLNSGKLTVNSGTVNQLALTGGTLAGSGTSNLSVGVTTVSQKEQPVTLSSINIVSKSIKMSCSTNSCQFFTSNAALSTP